MSSLDRFAQETAMLAGFMGIFPDSQTPVIVGSDLDLFGRTGVAVVLRCGLGIVVNGRTLAYHGPIPRAQLEAFEEEMLRYANSFC
jgi:hypothetical protein